MLMSVQNTPTAAGATQVPETTGGVYASLFEKINLHPVDALDDIDAWQDSQRLADASADERVTAAVRVFLERLKQSGQQVEKLDKTLLDHHIAELDRQISRQLDTVMHHPEFQQVESLWRGLKHLVNRTDYRQNVRTEILDIAKEDLRQDFEDAPEIIQSGLYWHTYTAEYDTPGGEPVGAVISSYEFDASAQDMALLRNISKVSAAAHMPFIGAVGPKFFLKDSMEEVAAIKDIGNYFDRAEYIKWKAFRDTDDARYIGLTLPRVLGRLPYGPDTVPVRSFNYVEEVKGPDHEKYLWTSASFAFAANMVKSFINNGWCVQIRGPQAGGAVQDLPIHLYDLGTGSQVKIPSEVMIPETREFEFANLGFIPLSYYKNRDYACFFSANSAQKPALYDTPDATANSRINARLPYIFLLSRIAHYLKLIQRENIGTTKDRRLLELELNNWVRGLVTEMTDPGDELQASHPLRDAKVVVEDIEDNPGFFRVRLYAVPHFQVEGMDVSLSLVKAQGPVLAMTETLSQINQANIEMQALNNAAKVAQALTCDIGTQLNLVQDRLAQLHSAVVLASAPQGVALSSGEHLQLTSTKNTMINAGQHLDVGAMKNLSVTVEKALGLFAHKDGAKVVANQGEVEIQAQHNTMSLFARDRFTITSNEDEIVISTPETLTLNGGGSYLKLSKSGIEHGSQGDMLMKVATYLVTGTGATLPHEAPEFSMKDITQENTMSSKAFND
ncbi:type VI secretion system contractile sheath large subunit [Cronobacter sakazakii]|nr:type VI secretion system contractile sheath large subunit [Cronobacter sakazakii]EKY1959866.1 type VI secretion system contractile sheath large subunit [Cronobacter sakazakii]EKY1968407.1 type VI secretion system contractile sheath large subunit [Cronobacter sakazakii]EKY2018624.1 type VI secretion system contractile sheath large subunit [Cronobacter sakazakii]ELY7409921.1 type VI secretion system contractile sheath large subunit [Cronobacter sakazakii]